MSEEISAIKAVDVIFLCVSLRGFYESHKINFLLNLGNGSDIEVSVVL